MSEIEYMHPNVVGKFRRIPAKDGGRFGCAVEDNTSYDCDGAPCTIATILELIPGTDAPAVDPRDAEIADLRAKLAAMESTKPLAVLPPLTDSDLKSIAEHARINWMANHVHKNGWQRDYVHSLIDSAYSFAQSRIQPVNPEYLAALEEYYNAPNWPAQDTCRKKVEAIRARLAAGKGGE